MSTPYIRVNDFAPRDGKTTLYCKKVGDKRSTSLTQAAATIGSFPASCWSSVKSGWQIKAIPPFWRMKTLASRSISSFLTPTLTISRPSSASFPISDFAL